MEWVSRGHHSLNRVVKRSNDSVGLQETRTDCTIGGRLVSFISIVPLQRPPSAEDNEKSEHLPVYPSATECRRYFRGVGSVAAKAASAPAQNDSM